MFLRAITLLLILLGLAGCGAETDIFPNVEETRAAALEDMDNLEILRQSFAAKRKYSSISTDVGGGLLARDASTGVGSMLAEDESDHFRALMKAARVKSITGENGQFFFDRGSFEYDEKIVLVGIIFEGIDNQNPDSYRPPQCSLKMLESEDTGLCVENIDDNWLIAHRWVSH